MANKPLVIYHAHCTDGLTAAWCFWRQFGNEMEYHAGSYNKPPPDVFNRDVYLVDFSYKSEVVEAILPYANKVTLLDHHKSALLDLERLRTSENFNMEHSTSDFSGAMIAWNFVKELAGHKRPEPRVLQHVQDYDLWQFRLENTREIMHAVRLREHTMEAWDKVMTVTARGYQELLKEGTIVQKAFDSYCKNIIATNTREMKMWNGAQVLVTNCPGMFMSEVGNINSKGRPYSVCYFDNEDGRKFSLRSTPKIGDDVSVIASKFGGGGHKHAAGFTVERSHVLAHLD